MHSSETGGKRAPVDSLHVRLSQTFSLYKIQYLCSTKKRGMPVHYLLLMKKELLTLF